MSSYVTTKLAGAQYLAPYDDIPDDLIQMGGDVIFSKDGSVEFSHASQSPSDRPEISTMIKVLTAKNEG